MKRRGFLHVVPDSVPRPDLRHPARDDVVLYRVRADLDHAEPPIWRLIDLRSDVPLDVLHQVLQVAFGWTDSHLHRFSLGGGAFDHHSQLFLCPYDVEGDDWDDPEEGLPAAEVRLDETLCEPGDALRYLYDYGDTWELTLRLEQILPAADSDCATAVVIDGRRAAPPEDCGGITDGEGLAEILDDPSRFERERVNTALRGPFFLLRESGIDPGLIDLVHRLTYTAHGENLTERALRVKDEPTSLDHIDPTNSLRAHQWFLDRAKDSDIPLTAAGYLKPADVAEASKVLPAMADWIGTHNREAQCAPLLHFRQSMQVMGLLRKYKSALRLTRAGAAAQADTETLWEHLACRLLPNTGDKFETQATLLLLAYAGGSTGTKLAYGEIASLLAELGWRYSDGRPVSEYSVRCLAARQVLVNVTDVPASSVERDRISPTAAVLARRALRRKR